MRSWIVMAVVLAGLSTGCVTKTEPAAPRFIMVRSVATSKSNMTTVVLARDESVSIKGAGSESLAMGQLMQKLEARGIKKDDPIFIDTRPGTPYAVLAKLISLLQQAGYSNIALVTDKSQKRK